MNLEEQYHAEGMLRKIERVEAERDNAWTELREIRAAISANPEESTLDEVVKLRQQLDSANKPIANYWDVSTRRRNADDMGNPPANAAELLNAWKQKP